MRLQPPTRKAKKFPWLWAANSATHSHIHCVALLHVKGSLRRGVAPPLTRKLRAVPVGIRPRGALRHLIAP